MNTKEIIKGYKGFDKNLKCRNYQFEVGRDYKHEGSVKACESGFHFCENPMDVFNYYSPAENRFCEVEGSGDISKHDLDSKIAVSHLKITGETGLNGIIKAGVKFIFDRVKWSDTPATNTGDYSAATNTGNKSAATNTGNYSAATNTGNYSAATNTGNYSAATNTGYKSAATNTGDHSAATNTGDHSAATNTGNKSAATNTGDHSAATNTGNKSAATNTGDYSAATNTGNKSAATNTGNYSAAINTGDYSAATNTGDYSAATNTGNYSAAVVRGEQSVAIVTGYKGKAKGKLGCWIVITERDMNMDILSVQSFKVDGNMVKEDVYYTLENNELKEVE